MPALIHNSALPSTVLQEEADGVRALKDLVIAERFARAAHQKQIEESTGDPYINHVIRVVSLVEGIPAQIVAWLHDVIEDSNITKDDLLKGGISYVLVASVLLLTRNKASETYAQYIERIANSGDALAIQVKIADLEDHLRPGCPMRLRPRYLKAWARITGQEWATGAPSDRPGERKKHEGQVV